MRGRGEEWEEGKRQWRLRRENRIVEGKAAPRGICMEGHWCSSEGASVLWIFAG